MEENKRQSFPIVGMSCANCAMKVEKFLNQQADIEHAIVNFASKEAVISFNELNMDELADKVKDFGYELILPEQAENLEIEENQRFKLLKKKVILALICTIPVFAFSMLWPNLLPYPHWIILILSIPVIFWSGSEFFINAWNQLKHYSANMDTLVAIGTGSAFVYSLFNTLFPNFILKSGLEVHVYYESATVIITFILLGRFWEEKAKTKAASAIKKLMGLQPKTLNVIRDNVEMQIPIQDVILNDIVIIKPGEKVAVDGKVIKGVSYIDESMITGEPLAVVKNIDDQVFAGTINQDSVLHIKALKIGSDTLLQQIIRLVKEAQSSKPPIQKLADKIASIFVPIVLLIGIITFLIWLILGPQPQLTHAFVSFITVMIIACPCALGLATPTALMVGMGRAAQNGIIIKDSQGLEQAIKTDLLVFDKTGTITEGKPKVIESYWIKNDLSEINKLIALEQHSSHPLAQAVLESLSHQTTDLEANSYENISGQGIQGDFDGIGFYVGNQEFLNDNNLIIDSEIIKIFMDWKSKGYTLVYFGSEKELLAVFGITDQIRSESAEIVNKLNKRGIECMILTGDHTDAAARIADQAGITKFKAGLKPQDKVDEIKQLQSEGFNVTMVGDGINDSAALAQANLGIALASGSDIAMESAGITLIKADLKQILSAIKLSKETVKTIKQNLFWAFIYNIIALPIAAGILYPVNGFLLNPMIAGAAMALSSVSVVMNSLRLRKIKL